jgi:hypothetical protein
MAWTFKLCNIATDTLLADVTGITLQATVGPRASRPMTIVLDLPCDQAALKTIQADGDPALWVGTRAIKAYRNGTLRGHAIVTNLSYEAGEDYDMKVKVTAMSPMFRFSSRMVWDSTGRIAYPIFSDPITGGALLRQVIANSIANEDDLGTPRRFEITTSGATDTTTVNIAHLIPDAPLTIAELVNTLTETGVVDIVEQPVDSSMGVPAGVMSRMNTYNLAGSDRSGTVHFDFDTGSKNVAGARRVIDLGTLANEIVYELGPKIDNNHYRGNISGTELTPVNLSSWQAMQLASRAKYGSYTNYRVYDDDGDAESRPLFHQLWKTEVELRVNPRDLVYFTPAAGGDNFAQFGPFDDFNLGDLVAISASDNLGPAISNTKQRIYGFDVAVNSNGDEEISELICSADAE